jgi:hypothetical protein
MKTQAAAVQGGLAALGLIAAYTTWQREPERKAGEVVVVSASLGDVQKIRYEDGTSTPTKWVELEPRKEADGSRAWLRVSARGDAKAKTETPERELRGNESATKVLEKFAPLKATRALGVLPADKLKELALDAPKKRIELVARGQKRVFLVGNSPFGMSDPYVRDEADNKVYVLGGGIFADLENAPIRLVDRQLHDWKTSDFDGLVVTAGDKKRELVQTSPEVPAQAKLASKSGRTDELAKNWHDKLFRLVVADVLGKGESPKAGAPQITLRVDYTMRGRPKGFLEIGRVVPLPPADQNTSSNAPPPTPATEYYARSEPTPGWVKLSGAPEQLLTEGAKIAAAAE